MRSIYFRILLASFGTVLVALAAFLGIFFRVSRPQTVQLVEAFEDVLATDAGEAYDRGGASAAAAYLSRVEAAVPHGERYLVDANGRDVVAGTDRSPLVRGAGRDTSLRDDEGRDIFVHASADGRYRLITAARPPIGITNVLPYFALVLVAVGFVSWAVAIGIAWPIRDMATTVTQFGRGHFAVRASEGRSDEIGRLAAAFNRMAERIETLVTAERRLLQDVSHELRTPLTRLSMAIELSRTAPDRNVAADRLQREADRLSQLVGMLLDVTRLEGAADTPLTTMFDVTSVMRDVVSDCELEAHSRGCGIIADVDAMADIQVRGNPELLRRALENTVRNAVRYAPAGTMVEVRCEQYRSEAQISVRDFGPGVPDAALSQLGSPFYRVDPSRDPSSGGVGLGLAIARRAIQLHHGMWSVENANPGLRVVMTIPAASPIAA